MTRNKFNLKIQIKQTKDLSIILPRIIIINKSIFLLSNKNDIKQIKGFKKKIC